MNASFPRSDDKKTGYHAEQVDAFLDRARRSYDGTCPPDEAVTADELRTVSFDLQKGGYSARFVDAALDRLEDVFFERERRQRIRELGEEAWRARVRGLALEIRGRVTQPKGKRFRRMSVITSGYKRSQVDAFLDKIAGFLDGRNGLTPLEVRDVTFHTEIRGYNEDQVDLFLDAVIELILSRR
ncbi:DivIVA domain-containing protein [Leucobacter sp. M11]|uniref:DivIVA domain-containing protein n=1 Tax=Leucobacter sp. M11 TaxID=2993565 RepID=UPI002D7E49D3|nr:DivIVA domain-containing protein [Leucobacter sp. M11]MEB4613230.1 DivIVA domain-containing protein [Leucobacter sp. M11]